MTRALTCCVLFLAAASASAQEHPALRWGMPDTGHVLVQDQFVMSYDGRLRSARLTAERLTGASLQVGTGVDRQDRFRRDPRIAEEFRAELPDYVNSDRDRGHLANSANHRLTQAQNDDTFYLSNMSPQVGVGLNQAYWRRLEDSIRNLNPRSRSRRGALDLGKR